MDITIYPNKLSGTIDAIPSKSHMHRLLICAAFADRPTTIYCPITNQDIEATAQCLTALGAQIIRTSIGYFIHPVKQLPRKAVLDCKESGSTLRFLLPIAGSLGVETTFMLSGRLPDRPLSPLWEEMERMGCHLSRPSQNTLQCTGQLRAGNYTIDGSVSSQFISGLLFALAIIPGDNHLKITGKLESRPYVDMTIQALSVFGVRITNDLVRGHLPFSSPENIYAEGDWSNAAFFLCANSLGSSIKLNGLQYNSSQGDKTVVSILPQMTSFIRIDAADIPDLVPVLAVTAGAQNGAIFTNIQRLRYKESDRVAAIAEMLEKLGAKIEITENTLTVYPCNYRGCVIDSHGDHRIAMSAAIAATVSTSPITILDAHCVCKSYPAFWSDYESLGGHYVQYVR